MAARPRDSVHSVSDAVCCSGASSSAEQGVGVRRGVIQEGRQRRAPTVLLVVVVLVVLGASVVVVVVVAVVRRWWSRREEARGSPDADADADAAVVAVKEPRGGGRAGCCCCCCCCCCGCCQGLVMVVMVLLMLLLRWRGGRCWCGEKKGERERERVESFSSSSRALVSPVVCVGVGGGGCRRRRRRLLLLVSLRISPTTQNRAPNAPIPTNAPRGGRRSVHGPSPGAVGLGIGARQAAARKRRKTRERRGREGRDRAGVLSFSTLFLLLLLCFPTKCDPFTRPRPALAANPSPLPLAPMIASVPDRRKGARIEQKRRQLGATRKRSPKYLPLTFSLFPPSLSAFDGPPSRCERKQKNKNSPVP